MALNRTIHIKGEISEDSFVSFRKKVLGCIKENKKPISVILTSGGGDAYAALAFHDFLISLDFDIRVHATGLVASAAVIILAAGARRTMSPSSWVMCHEDQPTFESEARVTQLERDIAHARRLEDQWNAILAFNTKVPASEWARIHKTETYLTADECLKLGLIDEII
jgi:ATP-dependent Clp protease protease subunit